MKAVGIGEIVAALQGAAHGIPIDAVTRSEYLLRLADAIEARGIVTEAKGKGTTAKESKDSVAIAPPDGMVLVRKDLVEFLHGAEQFGGVWFGEKHPNHVGSYWWRKFLSAAPEVKP